MRALRAPRAHWRQAKSVGRARVCSRFRVVFYIFFVKFLRDARKNYGDARALQIFFENRRKTIAALDKLCKDSLEHSYRLPAINLECANGRIAKKFFGLMKVHAGSRFGSKLCSVIAVMGIADAEIEVAESFDAGACVPAALRTAHQEPRTGSAPSRERRGRLRQKSAFKGIR
jgi:hypothetical protein